MSSADASAGARAEVAAVIPSWNTARHLERCVRAVREQDDVTVETVVVENGSQDGSRALAERLGVRVIALERNIGFAAAVNLGAAHTDARLVLVLNADCFIERDCVRVLAAALAQDGTLGGVQPRIVQVSDEPAERSSDTAAPALLFSAGQGLTRSCAAFERGWGEPEGPPYDDRREVFGVSGAACLLRRELFTQLGGYDERYFAFYEDVDLNARARLSGWRFEYVPEALARHVGHAGWQQGPSASRFNVSLTVRNRMATAVKVLPPIGVAGAATLTLRSLAASPRRRTAGAAFSGAAGAMRWLPRLLDERRRLRGGSVQALDRWLERRRGAGPDPTRSARARATR